MKLHNITAPVPNQKTAKSGRRYSGGSEFRRQKKLQETHRLVFFDNTASYNPYFFELY